MDELQRIHLPLHFLPAFELVARHLSVKRAAAELHLTSSAVSQQIHALEQGLQLKLFTRLPRALALTPAGEQFAEVVGTTLDTFRQGTRRLQRSNAGSVFRVTADPFVAHELLIPQLHAFQAQHPAVDLRLETSAALADLTRGEADAAIRYGSGPWPGLASSKLCDIVAAPVCAPSLLEGGRLRNARKLARLPLIRLRDHPDPWTRAAHLLGAALPSERLVFDSYFACIRAAEEGLGVAFALFPITAPHVVAGRLVLPLALRLRVRNTFQFLCLQEHASRPELAAVRDWAHTLFAGLPALPTRARGLRLVDEPL